MALKRNTWIGAAVVVVLAGAGMAWALRKPAEEIKWRTASVDRGDITQRISATGTINALVQVPVGTQVSGVVTDLYADYNSLVKKGQIIARIDPTVWETQLRDAEAALQRAQATYDNAKADFNRNKRLASLQLVAESDLEAKEMAMKTASGSLESARAALSKARINLGYCTIQAPVNGVVVARSVDVGQTVAASFSTPNLFTIAQDLSRMKVEASIDEADIGLVMVGQRAFFTVDSFPEKQFKGSVSEVRLEPITNQNVVTYKVVMEVTNEPKASQPSRTETGPGTARYVPSGGQVYQGDLALMPGMTANVSIVTSRREQVLRVPAVALRFNPNAFLKTEEGKKGEKASQGGSRGPTAKGIVAKREDRIWILENGKPKAVPVQAGVSDGQFTEISGDNLSEGMSILTGVEDTKKASSSASPLGGTPGGMPRR
ncbi:efflux RND transporter periplasmic adaptor subunit [Holophaga foetida]|uniref:efflux RND transporter periplasmic adaptor subunit n=1 Tax=Holophaga foetida TaxID=35839 RepID=UPI00024725AF|nr:efflux RND transporter periplasmic adaptor subunit [Holophaga foetida]